MLKPEVSHRFKEGNVFFVGGGKKSRRDKRKRDKKSGHAGKLLRYSRFYCYRMLFIKIVSRRLILSLMSRPGLFVPAQ